MACEIELQGLYTPGNKETRALAYLNVLYNGNTYNWTVYVPENVNLSEFLEEVKPKIEADIDKKESIWAALDPKTRTIDNPLTGNPVTVDILKEEIVKPDVPDYYALRRDEYPDVAEQIAALWKGLDTTDYVDMLDKIKEIKQKYPKPIDTVDREVLKLDRTSKVSKIKVTISTGKQFDGDEISQTRMARALVGMQAAGAGDILWTLATNETVSVTYAELAEALILAGQEQSALWFIN